jgi:hypothetical protein
MADQSNDPLSMRAADSDRSAIAEVLGTAYAEGRLTIDEYHERLDRVMASSTYGELVPIFIDLPVGDDKLPLPVRRSGASATPALHRETSSGTGKAQSVVAIFGENHRQDDVHMGTSAVVTAVFGSASLDLTRATFAAQDVRITVNAVFGESRVTVPCDAIITVNVVPILGEAKPPSSMNPTVASNRPPRISISGVALLGAVHIDRAPAPPERLLRQHQVEP